jgi:preprotein translocase subunit SecY
VTRRRWPRIDPLLIVIGGAYIAVVAVVAIIAGAILDALEGTR